MKRVLITGASGGIGAHLAARAAESGYAVLGLVRRRPESDPGYPFLLADVTNPASVAAAFAQLRGEPLWGIINAAGAASMNLLLTTPPQSMARIVNTNLLGTMYCCAEASKLLIRTAGKSGTQADSPERGGRIVNFSSIAAPLALIGERVYAASKAGVEPFSRFLARDLAHFRVPVNAVAPGPLDTNLFRGVPPDQC